MASKEYIEILNGHGKKTGRIVDRGQVHSEGHWHASVHVWVFNRNNEILLQKRAHTKDSHPGLWDVSAAGHISPGEGPVHSALRELDEELGLKVSVKELRFIGKRKMTLISQNGSFINREFSFIYTCEWNGDPDSLQLQKKEVEAIRFYHIDCLKVSLENPAQKNAFVPHGDEYYSQILGVVAEETS